MAWRCISSSHQRAYASRPSASSACCRGSGMCCKWRRAVAAATALRHLQHMPEPRQHAEDADGLEAYARWCEDEMHRHAMAFLADWAENGRDELCRLTRKLSPSAGDPLPLLRPDD